MGAAAIPVAVAGLAMQAYGMYSSVQASRQIAAQKMAAAQMDAAELNQEAVQTVASSQRSAFEVNRQTQLVQSRALAVAAASGGGASDPTVLKIISNIGTEGSYHKAVALYEGEETARQLRFKASTELVSGEISADATRAQGRASLISGAGQMLSTGGGLYAKYGYRTPDASGAIAGSQPAPFMDAGTPNRGYS